MQTHNSPSQGASQWPPPISWKCMHHIFQYLSHSQSIIIFTSPHNQKPSNSNYNPPSPDYTQRESPCIPLPACATTVLHSCLALVRSGNTLARWLEASQEERQQNGHDSTALDLPKWLPVEAMFCTARRARQAPGGTNIKLHRTQ